MILMNCILRLDLSRSVSMWSYELSTYHSLTHNSYFYAKIHELLGNRFPKPSYSQIKLSNQSPNEKKPNKWPHWLHLIAGLQVSMHMVDGKYIHLYLTIWPNQSTNISVTWFTTFPWSTIHALTMRLIACLAYACSAAT